MSDSLDPVDVFREEARDLLVELERCLIGLGTTPDDQSLVDAAFRSLHTIKGSGSMFDLAELTTFAHDLETVFVRIRDSRSPVSQEIVDLTLEAVDHLSLLVDGGTETAGQRAEASRIVAELHALTGTDEVDQPDAAGPSDSTDTGRIDTGVYRIEYQPSRETFLVGTNPLALLAEVRELGECTVVGSLAELPSLDDFDPQRCYFRWSISVKGAVAKSALEDVFMFVDPDSSVTIVEVDQPRDLPAPGLPPRDDVAVPEAAPGAAPEEAAGAGSVITAGASSIKVRTDRLDRLVNLVGELVSLQAQVTLRASQLGDRQMAAHAEQLERLVREARGLSMEMHMVPVESLFAPFRRHVRTLAGELGREVSLQITGNDTELDRNVVEQLRDPLLHIVRNAIDHGIEAPDLRTERGKGRAGMLRLSADYSGAMVRIRVEDDGAGLDTGRIRARAEERGIIEAGSHLSTTELQELLFAPGFSTAATATAVSGRGVGMDVVRRNVEALSGTVSLSSVEGEGTTVELRIPLTLAIVEGLLAEAGGQLFLVKLEYIRECVDGSISQGRSSGDMLDFRGAVVPLLDLARFFGIGDDSRSREERAIIVVDAGDQRVGLVVDRLLGNHQSVVKSLGRLLAGIDGVSGAIFLSDGSPALMLDVERVVRHARGAR
jgi:two-component system, chemotaxis family, sensor kinase CheA